MNIDPLQAQAERTALRLILSNVVAKLAEAQTSDPMERRAYLSQMHDECKLYAEQAMNNLAGTERREAVERTLAVLDEFYKAITITSGRRGV